MRIIEKLALSWFITAGGIGIGVMTGVFGSSSGELKTIAFICFALAVTLSLFDLWSSN